MIDYNQKDIQHVFATNPSADHVLITEDGHTFLPKFKQFCEAHCKLNNIKFGKLLRTAFETKSVVAVAVELVDQIVNSDDEDTPGIKDELQALSFLELKSRCKKIDLRMVPKNKAEAIEMLLNAEKVLQENTTEEVSTDNVPE
jgi:hypothetical protein